MTPAPVYTTTGETFRASFDFMRSNMNIDAQTRLFTEGYQRRDELIRKRFNKDPFDISGERKVIAPRQQGFDPYSEDRHKKKLDEWIIEGRETDPDLWAGIQTSAEIEQKAMDIAKEQQAHFADVMSRNPSAVSRTLGSLGGGVTGGFTDPLNLATLPLGFGMSKSILKVALAEGAINAGVEVMSQPQVAKWQNELGFKYGVGEAAENVGFAFVGGAAFAAGLRSLAPAYRIGKDLTGSLSQAVLDKVSISEKLPSSVRDAAKYNSRVAHVDESAPPGLVSEREDVLTNREALQSTAEDLENYKAPRPLEREPNIDSVVTPSGGMEIQTKLQVVERADIITSDSKAFDQNLQPRERGVRTQSDVRIQEIAAKLDAYQLGRTRTSNTGAPIVGPDGMVESGNGRVLAIDKAFERHKDRSQSYRDYIEEQGFNTEGMKNPVLVRRRISDLSPEQRRKFTIQSNEDVIDRMSITERASSDAALISNRMMDLFEGGEVTLAANRGFVRSFADNVVAPSERNAFTTADGRLSTDGVRRAKAALLAKAYDDPGIISRVMEDPDGNIKSIGDVLIDVAGDWAKLRADISMDYIPADLDITQDIVGAVRAITDARDIGKPMTEVLGQNSLFVEHGVKGNKELILRGMYSANLSRPLSKEKVKAFLKSYVDEANKAQPGGGLLGLKEVNPTDLLLNSLKKVHSDKSISGMGINTKEIVIEKNVHPVYGMTYEEALEEVRLRAKSRPETINRPDYNSPKRTKLRQDAVDEIYNLKQWKKEKTLDLILGPPGAGKSSAIAKKLREDGGLEVDSDQFKTKLPEYDKGLGAGEVHAESKEMADTLMQRAILDGVKLVHPIVGGNAKKVQRIIDDFKDMGYNVNLRLVYIPTDESLTRVIARFGSKGRVIEPDVVLAYGDKPLQTYNKIKKSEGVSDYARYDNTTPKNTPAIIRESTFKDEIPGRDPAGRFRRDAEDARANQKNVTSTREPETKDFDLKSAENVDPLVRSAPPPLSNKIQSRRAELDRLLDEEPDLAITLEDGSTIALRELARSVDEDMAALEAITTCRVS